jgi:porphobilinogen synthase
MRGETTLNPADLIQPLFVIHGKDVKKPVASMPGVFQLSVEHAVLDTTKEYGVVAFATFATTTFLDILTTGKAEPGQACHVIRKKFDAGQAIL